MFLSDLFLSDLPRLHGGDDFVIRPRLTEQEALRLVATLRPQPGQLRFRLHAFRRHGRTQADAKSDNRAHDGAGIGARIDAFDKGAIDLDLVEGKLRR